MSRLVIKNGMVLTLDDAGTYHNGGTVIVENDRIVAIKAGFDAADVQPGDEVIDATDKIVMPGLIDLHYHTTISKGYNDHLPLWEHLQNHWYPLIRLLDPETAYWAALASYAESIKSGCTTVNDMYRQLGALAKAAEEIGIRATLCNVVAPDDEKIDTLQDNYDAYKALHGRGNGLIEVRIGIEWIPISTRELLRDARAMANELGAGLHVHFNESQTEVNYSVEKFGRRPLELGYDMGVLGPDCIAAHCVWLTDREVEMLVETKTPVSHNPNSNAKLGNGVARVPEMLQAGINIGLGHDGCGCNNSADMFEVMKWASLIQRATHADATLMKPDNVLRMATRNGAKALGHDTGALVAGKKADIILVETVTPMFTPMLRDTAVHMTSHLVFAANGSLVDTSIINGKVVMRNRKLVFVDEEKIVRETNKAFLRINEKILAGRRAAAQA